MAGVESRVAGMTFPANGVRPAAPAGGNVVGDFGNRIADGASHVDLQSCGQARGRWRHSSRLVAVGEGKLC